MGHHRFQGEITGLKMFKERNDRYERRIFGEFIILSIYFHVMAVDSGLPWLLERQGNRRTAGLAAAPRCEREGSARMLARMLGKAQKELRAA